MLTFARSCAVVVFAAALSAQCVPPSVIATSDPFASTHYLGTPTPPQPYPGFSHLFDAVVDGDINITRMDCLLYDDGVNPPQVGNTAVVEVWITPGTYVGNILNQAAWTQIGTGTLTVAASSTHSAITFGSGFVLPAGTWGVAVLVQGTTAPQPNFGPLHPLVRIPCITPGNPTGCTVNPPLAVRDQFLDISAVGVQRYAWQSGSASMSINLRIFYTPVPNSAFRTEYGTGCYRVSQSFYEWFRLPPGVSDLNNVGINLTPVGSTNYNVGPASAAFAPVASAPLLNAAGTAQLGVNETSAPQNLPFAFSFPGRGGVAGTTSQIVVAANGFVWLSGTSGGGSAFADNVASFLAEQPRLAAFWSNLDPSPTTGSGAVHFDPDPSGLFATVTWLGVQERTGSPGGRQMNFQLVLFANGQVELRYANTYLARYPALVGFSPGLGDLDPGSRDLVVGGAVVPFASSDGSQPLHLTATNRPVIGRTFQIQTDTIRPGSSAGLLAVGLQSLPNGVSLLPYGMPPIGSSVCNQYVALPVESVFFVVNGSTAGIQFPIPNRAIFNGVELKYQSIVVSPGLSPSGLIASNGLCVHAGIF